MILNKTTMSIQQHSLCSYWQTLTTILLHSMQSLAFSVWKPHGLPFKIFSFGLPFSFFPLSFSMIIRFSELSSYKMLKKLVSDYFKLDFIDLNLLWELHFSDCLWHMLHPSPIASAFSFCFICLMPTSYKHGDIENFFSFSCLFVI